MGGWFDMKQTRTGKWVYSDENIFTSEEYASKEAAIAAGKNEYGDTTFKVGEMIAVEFEKEDIGYTVSEKIIEDLIDTLEGYVGEASDYWEVTDEEEKDLHQVISRAIMSWIKKHNLQPTCYKVGNLETINKE